MVVLAGLYPNRYRSKVGIGRLFACARVQGRLNSNVVTGGIAKEAVAEVMLGLLSGQRKMESSGVHAASLVALRCMLWELLNLRKAGIQWLVGRETMAVNWKAS